MDVTTIVVALVGLFSVAVTAIGAPMLLARQLNKQHQEERQEDWDREDLVAKRLEQAGKELRDGVDEVARKAEEATTAVDAKMDALALNVEKVHELVNSNVTNEQRRALVLALSNVTQMELLIDANRKLGTSPTVKVLASLEAAKSSVEELQASLLERERQQGIVNDMDKEEDQ